MRTLSSKRSRRAFIVGTPIGMTLAAPAFAATFMVSPEWPNYLLVASLAVLALGVTVRAIEGRGSVGRNDMPSASPDSIDIYRNSALKP